MKSGTANSADMSGVDSGASGNSKKAKRLACERQLEEINNELQLKSGSGNNGVNGKCTKKQKMKPEQEIILLEQKCVLLLKLKRHREIIDDGYSVIGRMGPSVVIYKCILVALVRLGKSEDDFLELLDSWKKATPKCLQMQETKRKFDGYLTALRSGVKHCDIFSGIEGALGLSEANKPALNKQGTDNSDEKRWKYRTPPPRYTTFSLCPRASSSTDSCIYGEECLFAHSLEEFKEWKMREEVDKKNNNNSLHGEDCGDENVRSGKKRPTSNNSLYRSLQIPPLCIQYLSDLGKKIKEAVDIKEVLMDEAQGVKIKIENPLKTQRRLDGINKIQSTWSFYVASKMPMGTVTILHDADRECFRVSTATYFNKKKEQIGLIELHPNNKVQTKLQVLNTFIQPALFLRFNSGWPEMCYYKVDVTFESRDPFPEPKLYRQSIVFDFKKDPKVVKHISVEILPKVEPIGNHLSSEINVNKSAWAVTPSPVSQIDVSSLHPHDERESMSHAVTNIPKMDSFISVSEFPALNTYESVKVNDFSKTVGAMMNFKSLNVEAPGSVTGQSEKQSLTSLLSGSFESDLSGDDNLFLENIPLSQDNYCAWLRDFLDVEHKEGRKLLNEYKKIVDLTLFTKLLISQECIYKYSCRKGDMYGKIDLPSDILCDSNLQRLINNCSSVMLSHRNYKEGPFRKPSQRYLCNIVEKFNSAIVIVINKQVAEKLSLVEECSRQVQIQFVLDVSYINALKSTLSDLTDHHMELLFPNFGNSKLPFLKVLDAIGMLHEEELALNNRQMNAYNLVNGRKVLIDGDIFTPPLLITGGVATGKTYVLAQCLRALLRPYSSLLHNRILVCTQSDWTADLFITEYIHPWLVNDELSFQRSKPLRIFDSNRFVDNVRGTVKHYCLFDSNGINFRSPTREEVLSHGIIITTFSACSELIRLALDKDTFSHILIDEATFCMEAECIQPIVLAGKETKLVIAGDIAQSRTQFFSESTPQLSLLERLRNTYPFRHPFAINLTENYTNHEVIVKLISEFFYHDQLRPASNQPCHPQYYPLVFRHVPNGRELFPGNGGGFYNMEEILHVVEFMEELVESWPRAWGAPGKDSIVITTPYTNQVVGLRAQLQLKGLQMVNVELASNIMGKKYRVVFISTVRAYKEGLLKLQEKEADGGFFSDKKLVKSALCCAKSMVVVFGEAFGLWDYGSCRDIWKKYITECHLHKSLMGLNSKESQAVDSPKERPSVKSPDFPQLPDKCSVLHSSSDRPTPPVVMLRNMEQPLRAPVCKPSPLQSIVPKDFNKMGSNPNESRERECDKSWNMSNLTLQEAPTTDLFSAFNSNVLYTPSKVEFQETPKATATAVLKAPELSSNPLIVGSYGISTFKAIEQRNYHLEPKHEKPSHSTTIAPINRGAQSTSLFQPLQVYCSPFELQPPVGPPSARSLDEFKKLDNRRNGLVAENDLSMLVQQPMPLPVPTIPSRILFNSEPESTIRAGLEHMHSPSAFSSPILRGPPGFISIPVESKIGNFSNPPENKISFPMSPQRLSGGFTGAGAGFCRNQDQAKYSNYKRNTYELPPRMLKNLHLTTVHNKSPVRKRNNFNKSEQDEMNFFEELGLDLQETNEKGRSASSASSEQSFLENEGAQKQEGRISSQNEWIEVKSTRKGKNQVAKRAKSREKHNANSAVNTGEYSQEINPSDMSEDDKLELITQMGFSRALAIQALEASGKDLQGAVDWLVSNPPSKS